MADTSISDSALAGFEVALNLANKQSTHHITITANARQPVHVVYGGAHLFRAGTAQKLGNLALLALNEYAPDAEALALALAINLDLAHRIYPRIVSKLMSEPIEDFRIDFEDGSKEVCATIDHMHGLAPICSARNMVRALFVCKVQSDFKARQCTIRD